MIGPGVYDDVCTSLREQLQAHAVVLVVINGTRGDGMSCQGDARALKLLPTILHLTANQLECDISLLRSDGYEC